MEDNGLFGEILKAFFEEQKKKFLESYKEGIRQLAQKPGYNLILDSIHLDDETGDTEFKFVQGVDISGQEIASIEISGYDIIVKGVFFHGGILKYDKNSPGIKLAEKSLDEGNAVLLSPAFVLRS